MPHQVETLSLDPVFLASAFIIYMSLFTCLRCLCVFSSCSVSQISLTRYSCWSSSVCCWIVNDTILYFTNSISKRFIENVSISVWSGYSNAF